MCEGEWNWTVNEIVFDSVKLVDRQREPLITKLDPKQSFIRLTINHDFLFFHLILLFNKKLCYDRQDLMLVL